MRCNSSCGVVVGVVELRIFAQLELQRCGTELRVAVGVAAQLYNSPRCARTWLPLVLKRSNNAREVKASVQCLRSRSRVL